MVGDPGNDSTVADGHHDALLPGVAAMVSDGGECLGRGSDVTIWPRFGKAESQQLLHILSIALAVFASLFFSFRFTEK